LLEEASTATGLNYMQLTSAPFIVMGKTGMKINAKLGGVNVLLIQVLVLVSIISLSKNKRNSPALHSS
jgi:hypothetical protein